MRALLTFLALTAGAALASAQTTPADSDNTLPSSDSIPADSPAASPATPTSPATANVPATSNAGSETPEASILTELHSSNLAEIRAGTLAERMATSPKVKHYARMLIRDHTKADNLVTKEANRLSVALTDALSDSDQAAVQRIQSTDESSFDKVFCDVQEGSHAVAIDDVEATEKTISDSGVRALLDKLLPTLRRHQKLAQQLSGESLSAS